MKDNDDNNGDQKRIIKNNNNFDNNDALRLKVFSYIIKGGDEDDDDGGGGVVISSSSNSGFSDPIDNSKFQCFKFCRKFNILKLHPNHTYNNTLRLMGYENDSLYINAHYQKFVSSPSSSSSSSPLVDNCIYITNHLPCKCLINKKSVLDYLLNSPDLKKEFNQILYFPKRQFWSYDGYSIEFINDLDIKNFKYPTLGMYLNQMLEQREEGLIERKKKYLSIFYTFITFIESIFLKTNFLPYFIHPNRILFYKTDCLKFISGNLFCFLFTPHDDNVRLRSALFSHPITFNLSEKKHDTARALLDTTTMNIIADFFHSSYVTALWICTIGEYKNNYILKRNGMNNNNNVDDVTIIKKNKKYTPSTTTTTTTNNNNNINNHPPSSSSNILIKKCFLPICKNKFGFCKIFNDKCSNNDEEEEEKIKKLVKEIHNYGCVHLLEVLPEVIIKAIEISSKSGNVEHVKKTIKNLFFIFKMFITELKNTI